MNRIIDGRGTGKTKQLMLAAKDAHGTIVCANPRAMEEKAYAYGIIGINFISYSDYLNHITFSQDSDMGNYFIDEVEELLNYIQTIRIVQGKFCGYTLTNED